MTKVIIWSGERVDDKAVVVLKVSGAFKEVYRYIGKTNKLYYTDKNLSTSKRYFYKVASTTRRQYKDNNLKSRKTYYYKVLATTNSNITEPSKYRVVTTK